MCAAYGTGDMGFVSKLIVLLIGHVALHAAGQGYNPATSNEGSVLRASQQAQQTLLQQWQSTRQIKALWSRQAAASGCHGSQPKGLLCQSMPDGSSVRYEQLILLTSPLSYNASDTSQTGGFNPINPPRDQRPCEACVGFTVTSAAESAIASVMQVNASQTLQLSPQDLQFCSPHSAMTCSSGWTFPQALQSLVSRPILQESCLPYQANPADGKPSCSYRAVPGCIPGTNPYSRMGSFSYIQINAAWEAQRHIRMFGSVITRFNVMDDFTAFFANKSNIKKVYSPGPNAGVGRGHAVVLVGYSMEAEPWYWLVKNSWGQGWADGGFAKVAMGCCGILNYNETFGVIWTPNIKPANASLRLKPAPVKTQQSCWYYTATPYDYISKLSWQANIPIETILMDNRPQLVKLDEPLAGKTLLLCGIDRRHPALKAYLNKTLGLTETTGAYLSAYNSGILSVLEPAGVLQRGVTPMAGTVVGAIGTAAFCSNTSRVTILQYLFQMRDYCSTRQKCYLQLQQELEDRPIPLPDDAWQRCRGKGYIGMTLGKGLNDPNATHYLVSDYRSQQDLLDAIYASMFIPALSAPMTIDYIKFRGQPALAGYPLSPAPSPRNVSYSIRMSPFPAPDVYPQLGIDTAPGQSFVFPMLTNYVLNPENRNITFADVFGPDKSPLEVLLGLQPTAEDKYLIFEQNEYMGNAAGVDFAPGIYHPLPLDLNNITVKFSWWYGMVATPDDALMGFLFDLGALDAHRWLELTDLTSHIPGPPEQFVPRDYIMQHSISAQVAAGVPAIDAVAQQSPPMASRQAGAPTSASAVAANAGCCVACRAVAQLLLAAALTVLLL